MSDNVNRSSYLGGSDSAKVLGEHAFEGPRSVYEKLKQGEDYEEKDLSGNKDIQRGNFCEPLALDEISSCYPSLNDEDVYERFDDGGGHDNQVFLRHPDKVYIGGHPDGISIDPFDGTATVHEVKAPRSKSVKYIKKNGIPSRYYWQVLHYGGIVDAQTEENVQCVVWVWNCDKWDVERYDVEYNADGIAALFERYSRFWAYAQEGIEWEKTDLGVDYDYEPNVVSSDKLSTWLRQYGRIHSTFKEAKEQKKDLKGKILSAIPKGTDRIEGDTHYAKIKNYSNSTHLIVRDKS